MPSRPIWAIPVALLAVAVLVGWPPTPAGAQPDADAATVAGWVQAFYDQTRTLSARFTQRYVNRVYQRTDLSRGRVRFKRPGRMRFDYDDPNGKVIVSDGSRLLAYEPGEDGGRGQYFERTLEDDQLSQALGLLMGTARLDRDFRFRLLDASRQGYADGYVLELRSRGRASPHYSRILLYVDGAEERRGVVHRVLIVDPQNNRNRFDLEDQRLNPPMPDRVFAWEPPEGARRIEP
ncbi:MAG: outer membrane lipoprotein carrier protein LolA [Sandaracinaceae bacterium]